MINTQELIKALKTDKARRAYADEDRNWDTAGVPLSGGLPSYDGKPREGCVYFEQLNGFSIFRVRGWCKGFCEAYPDHFATLYTFEVSSEGYVVIDDLRSSAKLSAAMKKQMEEWKEEGK